MNRLRPIICLHVLQVPKIDSFCTVWFRHFSAVAPGCSSVTFKNSTLAKSSSIDHSWLCNSFIVNSCMLRCMLKSPYLLKLRVHTLSILLLVTVILKSSIGISHAKGPPFGHSYAKSPPFGHSCAKSPPVGHSYAKSPPFVHIYVKSPSFIHRICSSPPFGHSFVKKSFFLSQNMLKSSFWSQLC